MRVSRQTDSLVSGICPNIDPNKPVIIPHPGMPNSLIVGKLPCVAKLASQPFTIATVNPPTEEKACV